MSSFEDKNYLHHYQNLKCEENDFDPFVTCNIRRKCIAQAFHASLTLGSNDTTCALLKENLQCYAEIVDRNDAESINNYAKSTLALISHCKTEHEQWKSSLHLSDPSEFLKSIESSSKCPFSDKPQSCKNSEVETDDIQAMLDNLSIPIEYDSIPVSLPIKTATPMTAPPIAPRTNNFEGPGNVTRPTGCNFVRPNINAPPVNCNRFPQSKPVQNQNSFNQGSRQVRFPTNPNVTNPRSNCSEPINNEASSRPNIFKTAREELGVQNQKKWGSGGGNNGASSGMYNYGDQQKKSLGTRRGAFNKFVPPIRPENDDDASGRKRARLDDQPAEEVDERLKNIDPKMVEMIRSEIMDNGAEVGWDDIAGLEFAKSTIQEIVVWPLLRPDIFTGLRRPPKGILLFGPPGTGKTLIGKCIAAQSRSTFFSISASSLTSKWIGDGEKMVRALFAVARCHQPAVVFIDEIDSLLTQRSDTEHESSRRIKTEFLVQLDGATTGDEERILVVGATNRPQELDEAARRRLVKRLYIPLPETKARRQIVERLLSTERHSMTDEDIDEVAELTAGYSGSDVKNLCQEASLGPIRSLGFTVQIEQIQPDQVRGVNVADFTAALSRVRASVSPGDLESYIKWDKTYGSGGAPFA